MQSHKIGHRSDMRPRQHRVHTDSTPPRNFNEAAQDAKVSAVEGAVRVANLKLLLASVGGDVSMLSAGIELPLPRLQPMLDGLVIVGNEVAMHIVETLRQGQGWLDCKHDANDVTFEMVEILHGRTPPEHELEVPPLAGAAELQESASALAERSVAPAPHSEPRNLGTLHLKVNAGSTLITPAPQDRSPLLEAPETPETPKALEIPEIPQPEQKGLDIMTTGTSHSATPSTSAPIHSRKSSTGRPSEQVITHRIANLTLITMARGAKSQLARLLDVSDSIISFLFNRKKEFNDGIASDIETALHLPANWMDTPHSEGSVPAESLAILSSSVKSASPARAAAKPKKKTASDAQASPVQSSSAPAQSTHESGKRVHRVPANTNVGQSPLTLNFKATAAPSELLSGFSDAEAPISTTEAPVKTKTVAAAEKVVPSQTRNSRPSEISPSPAAMPATAPVSENALTAKTLTQPESAKAPIAEQSVGQDMRAGASQRVLAGDEATNQNIPSPIDAIALSPTLDALLKTLTQKAKGGLLTDKDAYRLLGEVLGL